MNEQKLVLTMPRWGLPLYGQVLIWFFINVALVLAALWLVLRLQFGVSAEDLLTEQLRGRAEPRAELVAGSLRENARDQWPAILSSRGKELGVRLSVYTFDSKWTEGGGLPTDLRSQTEEALESVGPPRRMRPDREGPGRGRQAPPNGPGGERRGPPLRISREPARLMFSGKGASGGRWAGSQVYLGGEEFRHPPLGVLTMYAKRGERNEIFVDWRPLVFLGLGLLLLSGLVWFPFVRRVTRRLRVMTEGAERISEGDFEVNVASKRGDEIGRLSRVIQRMSSRLSVLVAGQKRFLGDTAHELCSPLVRIRMGLGVLEQRLEGADLERLQSVEEEVAELARLVDELLAFSKASLAKGQLSSESVDVLQLCQEVSERESLGVECLVAGPEELCIESNPELLKRALGNLVRNAARYGEGKPLKVKIERDGSEVWIGVLDRGPGLPEGWAERVFEPFARPEEARTREGGGAGLGLAIVKTCAESLGGRVFCRNRETGGLEVVLVLPIQGKTLRSH